jgi:hypothetical protein
LDYGDPSESYAAQTRSDAHKAPSSNTNPNKNLFDQFDFIPVPCIDGLLRGRIVEGDYEKVVRLFRDSHPVLRNFSLISPGGNVEEAIKIGHLFRKYAVTASAPFKLLNGNFFAPSRVAGSPLCYGNLECMCASACSLVWFGSVHRWGAVGLHRPHTEDPAFKTMSPSEASIAYKRMLDSVRKYLDEMEVPKQMIETMVATGSAEMQWIDATDDKVRRPPSFAEWEDASCGHFTGYEEETELQLTAKGIEGAVLTQTEKMLLNQLQEKQKRKTVCEAALISSHLERLPPP